MQTASSPGSSSRMLDGFVPGSLRSGKVQIGPQGFNWVGLAEISASLAREKDDLGWARVAVMVNTFLIREVKTHGRVYSSLRIVPPEQRGWASSTYEERIVSTRVCFLLEYGCVPGDVVFDCNLLAQSFFEDVPFSPEVALQYYAAGEKALSRELVWKLRQMRRYLEKLRPLAERSLLSQALLPWYAIREQLHFSY